MKMKEEEMENYLNFLLLTLLHLKHGWHQPDEKSESISNAAKPKSHQLGHQRLIMTMMCLHDHIHGGPVINHDYNHY